MHCVVGCSTVKSREERVVWACWCVFVACCQDGSSIKKPIKKFSSLEFFSIVLATYTTYGDEDESRNGEAAIF